MADITMCKGGTCPFKYVCFRHQATPGYWQSYFASPPYDPKRDKCDRYSAVEEGDERDHA